jgi:Domain of unknown function (DUF4338)
MVTPLPILTLEATLKREIRAHLRSLGFEKSRSGWLRPPRATKEAIRSLHDPHRRERSRREAAFVNHHHPALGHFFASGQEVCPAKIQPILIPIAAATRESNLFRLATLLWSVPVSQGYGRRLRFLVFDGHNNRLIGLFAIGDAIFNQRARDDWIGWSVNTKRQKLVNVMDAFVLGAVPSL